MSSWSEKIRLSKMREARKAWLARQAEANREPEDQIQAELDLEPLPSE